MSMNHYYKTGVALSDHQQKFCETPPRGGLTKTSCPIDNRTSLSRKLCITAEKLLWNAIMKSWSFRICYEKSWEAPIVREFRMTSYPVCNEASLSRQPCITDKKLLLNTFMKSWSLSKFDKKKTANIYSKNLSVYKCC